MRSHRAFFYRFFFVAILVCSARSSARAACQVEGPSLEETVKYLTEAGKTIVPGFSLAYNVSTGLIQLDSGIKQTVPAYLLDCSSFVVSGHPATNVKVWCRENTQCVNSIQKTGEPFVEPALRIYYEADDEHALRLSRALSHFVYLVQLQHDETKDPFASKH